MPPLNSITMPRAFALSVLMVVAFGCDDPKPIDTHAVNMAAPSAYARATQPSTQGVLIKATSSTLGVCMVEIFPKLKRLIVVETTSACREARHQRGGFRLVDTSSAETITTFDNYIDASAQAGIALVKRKGEQVLLTLNTGQALTPKTTRQIKGQSTDIQWVLSKDSPHVWMFEGWGDEKEGYSYHFTRLNGPITASTFSAPLDATHKALFWPDLTSTERQVQGDTLWVGRPSAPDGGSCALAHYTPDGKATCKVTLPVVRAWRHVWSPEQSILWSREDKQLRVINRPGESKTIPLPSPCSKPRVRLNDGGTLGALIQCEKRDVWSLVSGRLRPVPHPSRKDAWTFLRKQSARWPGQRVLSKRRATQGLLTPSGQQLWTLPAGAQILTPTLLNVRGDDAGRGLARWVRPAPASLVAPVMCKGRLWPLATTSKTWTSLVCAPAQLGASCEKGKDVAGLVLNHDTKQWHADSRALMHTQGIHVWAHQLKVREGADLCPASALELQPQP